MCSVEANVLECPSCGAPIKITDRICAYCKSEIYIKKSTDINRNIVNRYIKTYRNLLRDRNSESVEGFMALGLCHLNNNSFGEAIDNFNKAINFLPDDGEAYYYSALALMQGKRPYLQTLGKIKKIVQLLDTAIEIEPRGKYYYLLYLIQIDFYNKKKLNNHRSADELKQQAYACEIDDEELVEIKQFVGNI